MGLLDEGVGDHGPVLKHVIQIHQVAVVHVLGEIIRVVKMDDPFLVGLDHLLGEEKPVGDILADRACHVVSLHAVDHRVLVGILLEHFLVAALDKAEYLLIRAVGFSNQLSFVAVCDIMVGDFVRLMAHDLFFHHILDLLHTCRPVQFLAPARHRLDDSHNLIRSQMLFFLHGTVGFLHRVLDLLRLKKDFLAASLYNIHSRNTPYIVLFAVVYILHVVL